MMNKMPSPSPRRQQTTTSGHSSVPAIMVFRPTWKEFQDFNGYIRHIESLNAHRAGIAKIIPPPEWQPRPDGYGPLADPSASTSAIASDITDAIADLTIRTPINQVVTGRCDQFQIMNVQRNSLTVRQFQALATSSRHAPPNSVDTETADSVESHTQNFDQIERNYWRTLPYVSPVYGADVSGTLMLDSRAAGAWNPNRLRTILDLVPHDYNVSIAGVNSAYLYFGMWKSTFAWHTEDMDLYSLNYLHFGAPKTWYAVPPAHGRRLERLADKLFPQLQRRCAAHLRHKMTLINPKVLRKHGVRVERIEQLKGEFIVTFPYGYHAGYNHGFNCAEATNFASSRWIEYGKRAAQCTCERDTVRINMDTFVRRFQPERFHQWMMGLDEEPHPEEEAGYRKQRGREYRTVQRAPTTVLHICSPTKRNCSGTMTAITESSRKRRRR